MPEITKFEGDLFWRDDDREQNIEPEEELSAIGDIGIVIEFAQAKTLPNIFGVYVDKEHSKFFETEEEADAYVKETYDNITR